MLLGLPMVCSSLHDRSRYMERRAELRLWASTCRTTSVRSGEGSNRPGLNIASVASLKPNSIQFDHDTAAFAVATIGRWWDMVGAVAYPKARRLLSTADAGGSNGYRVRLWKRELARHAERTDPYVTMCHFRPARRSGRIEHRLFSAISSNWRGHPLVSYEVVVA